MNELTYTKKNKQKWEQYIEDINNLEEIRKNVSKLLPITDKINEYKNQEIIKNLTKFGEKFPYYRRIRGDGNCFYRAIIISFLEKIMDNQEEYVLIKIIREIQSEMYDKYYQEFQLEHIPLKFQKFLQNLQEFKDLLISGLKYLFSISRMKKSETQQLMYEFWNQCFAFDFAIVIFVRIITAYQFDNDEMVKFTFENEKDYIKERNYIFIYGEEAQSTILPMTYKALNVNVITNQIDKEVFTQMDAGVQNSLCTINLFFRPGHYDACYEKQQEQIDDIQEQDKKIKKNPQSIQEVSNQKVNLEEQNNNNQQQQKLQQLQLDYPLKNDEEYKQYVIQQENNQNIKELQNNNSNIILRDKPKDLILQNQENQTQIQTQQENKQNNSNNIQNDQKQLIKKQNNQIKKNQYNMLFELINLGYASSLAVPIFGFFGVINIGIFIKNKIEKNQNLNKQNKFPYTGVLSVFLFLGKFLFQRLQNKHGNKKLKNNNNN